MRKRENERGRQTERQTDRETNRVEQRVKFARNVCVPYRVDNAAQEIGVVSSASKATSVTVDW